MVRKYGARNRKGSKKLSLGSTSPGLPTAMNEVFGIDLLREEILKHAIHDEKGNISGKLVRNVRMVHKSWLQTTTKLLRRFKEPLINLTLDGNAEETLLGQLMERSGAPQRLQESFLPVKLNVKMGFFRRRNFQSLSDFLTRLGGDLVELWLEYPKSGANMPVTFPPFSLPLLRKLTFQFSDEELKRNIDGVGFGDNSHGLVLLQLILNASKDIRELSIPFTKNVNVVPSDFEYISLPSTISVCKMSIKLMSKDLTILLRNQLPNLSHLALKLHEVPFEDGLFFKILERLRKTLQTIQIIGIRSNGELRPHTHLRFPCMEKLKKIAISSSESELGPGNVLSLQNCLQELKVVKFYYQTEAKLAKWIKNSKFENVEELGVSVVNEQLAEEDDSYFISPRAEILTQLQHSFPNVWRMSLVFNISDLTGLQSLFRNMNQLIHLSIYFVGNLSIDSDLIDSAFLGFSPQLVALLKADIETIEIKGGTQPSILKLSELKTLNLSTKTCGPKFLMSDLLFRYGFLKMSQLRDLCFRGSFQPSMEMQQSWRREGRFINS